MANRYFFDKRDMKRGFAKYGIIFLISFVPILLFNIFVGGYLKAEWLVVLLDCVFLLVFVVIGNHIANKIFERKDKKLEARRKAREEMNARKKQILEDSYKRIREEKKVKKEKQSEMAGEQTVQKNNKKSTKPKIKNAEPMTNEQSGTEISDIMADENKKTKTEISSAKEVDENSTKAEEVKEVTKEVSSKANKSKKKISKNIRKEDGNEEK